MSSLRAELSQHLQMGRQQRRADEGSLKLAKTNETETDMSYYKQSDCVLPMPSIIKD